MYVCVDAHNVVSVSIETSYRAAILLSLIGYMKVTMYLNIGFFKQNTVNFPRTKIGAVLYYIPWLSSIPRVLRSKGKGTRNMS